MILCHIIQEHPSLIRINKSHTYTHCLVDTLLLSPLSTLYAYFTTTTCYLTSFSFYSATIHAHLPYIIPHALPRPYSFDPSSLSLTSSPSHSSPSSCTPSHSSPPSPSAHNRPHMTLPKTPAEWTDRS